MKTISLNGTWDLYYFKQDSMRIAEPSALKTADIARVDATVPGNVELDLSRAGVLPHDLYMGENIRELEKFEEYEWWYETTFDAPKEAADKACALRFGGVDCFAEYWLNGEKIGASDNMFIPIELDVTGKLYTDAKNTLTVRIRSAYVEAKQQDYPSYSLMYTWDSHTYEEVNTRKAPHCYGWDIMPRAVTNGLWKDVDLLIKSDYEIKQLFYFCPSVSHKKAQIRFNYELTTRDAEGMEMRVEGRCGDSAFSAEKQLLFKAGTLAVEIDKPKLWWPYGYGDANLYDTTVRFFKDGEEVICETLRVGIRSVRLDRSDITDGLDGNFEILINDVPIMCKGSNWVPLDAFHSRDKERYPEAMALVKDIGCNILRCWGGNVYEQPEFYDFCDANGVMVWQDFAMACHAYPQDESFQKAMKAEAKAVIRERRNHPSIVIWAGDNECDEAIFSTGGDPNDNVITRQILKRAVVENDACRPYLPSSPYFSEAVVQSGTRTRLPETHLWGSRDYYKSAFYTTSRGHFVSETGYHGCPSRKSIEKFIDPDYVWPLYQNPQWNLHSTDMPGRDHRVMLMEKQVRQLFGEMPQDMDEFVFASQISQAEAKKFFIENIRVHRETKKGIIWWNLLDGWPQMSDAVVDYYFEKKIAYDYIKRAQQPFALMCGELGDWVLPLVAANDTLETKCGTYCVKNLETDEVMAEGEFSVKPNSNDVLANIPVYYSEHGMLLIEWNIDGERFFNHYLYGMPGFSLASYKKWFAKLK